MASIGLKVIRSVFGAAEHIAPRITGRGVADVSQNPCSTGVFRFLL